MGEFTVFPTREAADAAGGEEEDPEGAISYLLEQQWKVPLRLIPTIASHPVPWVAGIR